jgi:GxxExxY protein
MDTADTQANRPLIRRDDEVRLLCDSIRGIAFALHTYLGNGHFERVYQNGLEHRLTKAGLGFQAHPRLEVLDDDGTPIGEYFADLLVEGDLLVELKAVKTLGPDEYGQILGYMRAARKRHGLLINFGGPRLEIRKFVW